ncbi:MAG TPA: alpha-L-arabinofuranosidase C-terminal domain-containing protein [Saprospiraceae bacterium]|nr:alpha-L-arabinofuranosidase C-terminal domain-containing protein [Saprospiraceae bacterium]
MNKLLNFLVLCLLLNVGQTQTKIVLHPDRAETKISKHIYGHFAEHLGRCIYDGFYVGENNHAIPNKEGVRLDVIEALKALRIPNLRWPGGCFADIYHWKDGIGPKNQRRHISNLSWGNIREDNSFGTHEFLNLCEWLEAEPYLAVNMNSGTVQEAMEWVQYVNHPNGSSALTDLRANNGREEPWNVTYWGIGNESWDCGGHMTVDHYINLYRQYATAMTSYSNTEGLYRIAVGPGSPDYAWTESLMKNIPARRIEGISIHHYSVFNWREKGSSTGFSEEEYLKTMLQAWRIDEFLRRNMDIMDKYDPQKRIALIVDEWGGWYDTDPEGNGMLYQQNTIRDAMIAGLTLNIFNNYAERVKMANLAQTVNVLQAVILTKGNQMLLTPTYHVMEMYKVHQNATLVPSRIITNDIFSGTERIPSISVSASTDDAGTMHISLTNIDHINGQEVEISIPGFQVNAHEGRILSSYTIQDHNTFEEPNKIKPKSFNQYQIQGNSLKVIMPPASVVVLALKK